MKEVYKIGNNLRMIKYTLNREELYEFLDPIDSKMTKKIHAIIKSHEKHGGDESKELDKISDLKCI